MTTIVDSLNSILWGYVLVYGLLGVGVFFTIRLGFLQFLNFGEMIRAIRGSRDSDVHGISPFQALCTSLASRVGTGNLAGVAVALYLGGAGAIFWMWMVALVGMATGYAESTLAQLYKVRDGKGQYRGGPAVYITKGLKAPWAGSIFAVCLILSFGLVFNAVQANSIADAMQGALGVPKIWVGIVIAVLAGIVIFGGLRSIVRFAELVVPLMAGLYVLIALVIMAINITEVPGVLMTIVKNAFGLEEAAG
ncbi:MAG: amino acid carrier protein, partial [Marinobacter sp.]